MWRPRGLPIVWRAMAGLVCVTTLGCGNALSRPGPGERLYRGTAPLLAFSLIYPAQWRLTEERGRQEPYTQVRLLGPRNAEDTYTAYITVRGVLPDPEGGPEESLDERVRRYTDTLLEGTAIESVQPTAFEQGQARELVVSVTIPPLFRSGLKPLPIPVKTRTVFLRRGRAYYEIAYSADAREYAAHLQVFERLLASLRFH